MIIANRYKNYTLGNQQHQVCAKNYPIPHMGHLSAQGMTFKNGFGIYVVSSYLLEAALIVKTVHFFQVIY